MHHYVMIFRTTRPLLEEQSQTRLRDIRQWAHKVMDMGIKLDPRNLEECVTTITPLGDKNESHAGPVDRNLVTMVFFEAPGNEKALEIAQLHPGPSYGVSLELREWSNPVPAAARAVQYLREVLS